MNRFIPRSRLLRGRVRGLAAVSALVAGLALPVVTANAAPSAQTYDRCPDGSFCLFSGENGTGATYGSFKMAADANTLVKLGLDGTAKSAWNRTKANGTQTPKKVNLYTTPTPSGTPIVISDGEKRNIGDKVRSLRVTGEAATTTTTTTTTTPAPKPADLMSITKCTEKDPKICARYDKRDGGVVDIEFKGPTPPAQRKYNYDGVVVNKEGKTLGKRRTDSQIRNKGGENEWSTTDFTVYRATVPVGSNFKPGTRLCAKVLTIGGSGNKVGELCFDLQEGPALPAIPPDAKKHNPAAWPCDASDFCIYSDINGKGSRYSMDDGINNLAAQPGLLDNHVYSVRNISGSKFCLYTDKGEGGDLITVNDGEVKNLDPRDAVRISSIDNC